MPSKPKTDRERYLAAKQGDLTSYAGMLGDEFDSKIDRLAQIIGRAHEPSVGQYKEALLRHFIAQFIPRRYSVGTGFIAFARESDRNDRESNNTDLWNLRDFDVSSQLDIIVYDDYNYPPILKEDEFVVLRPEAVRAVVEVKGFLSTADIIDSVDSFAKLGRRWVQYDKYINSWKKEELHWPSFSLMAWNVAVDTKGRKKANGKILRQSIVKRYRSLLSSDELARNGIPTLNNAFIYRDCSVFRTTSIDERGAMDCYATHRGRFVRYDTNGKAHLDRDMTISSLLASIHLSLETPFNGEYTHFDQSMTVSVFKHKHAGFTSLTTGEEH